MTACLTGCGGNSASKRQVQADTIRLMACPRFESDSAMLYVQKQCGFGPRVTGTKEAEKCGDYIVAQFRRFGAKVQEQRTEVTLYDGSKRPARNIIASINPDSTDRILLCAHWDTRLWADNDQDETNWYKPILGANDGASGVAVMMELCRLMQKQPIRIGVDFVCFDAEDLGTPQWEEVVGDDQETWCLGSRHWAQQAQQNGYKARYGILLDMVGGRGCTFSREAVSMQYAAPVVEMLWRLAGQLGYGHYFPQRDGGYLVDDHVNVNRIARIPCIDVVPYFTDGPSSFGPTWHTVLDTPDNIDPNVMEAVGQSVAQLLYNENAE